ncbi:N-acetyl-gamma-glutamyl-phosphate reductase [Zymomonas mobilis]|uniref:N-acetyl-gamma-glutamyl-phosphate reductase n=1 Tax=Zymomonas mobilis TaxID=542 RepID=UPI000B38453C|nr:N-acetyl-gamma-glutamyl-phosphate reductase [Zymomonas mobilis]ART92979.1 N-acetyl-gamma-glutamyl-phosphate reductase [Zymomonas mobilis subsp. mobilis]TWD59647.1 N-acetyl-gamma-glutamyl-phosphate reductase [Zymomonas mobilis]
MTALFIDGGAGTTGLEIRERLANRPEFSIITLSEEDRKDRKAREEALNQADIVILCLPDDAAKEAVSMVKNPKTRIVDASTAHRTAKDWVYGLPELTKGQKERIQSARFVANPGCYPSGFLSLVRPLTETALISDQQLLTVHAVSGYSGGGRKMIEAYESGTKPSAFKGYGLSLKHKHIPEMQHHAGLTMPPIFSPAVSPCYRGMLVHVPLSAGLFSQKVTLEDIHHILAAHHQDSATIRVKPLSESQDMTQIEIEHCANSDRMELFVFGNESTGQILLVAALDNLGKGAAGAAVQNINLMSGCPETSGLKL